MMGRGVNCASRRSPDQRNTNVICSCGLLCVVEDFSSAKSLTETQSNHINGDAQMVTSSLVHCLTYFTLAHFAHTAFNVEGCGSSIYENYSSLCLMHHLSVLGNFYG